MTKQIQVNIETLDITFNGAVETGANSKSDLFVILYEEYQCTIAEIKALTGCHYSFIFGVITKRCDKRDTTRTGGKADTIREMLTAGKTVSEIAKELETNYSYVFTVAKKWKLANADVVPTTPVELPPAELEEEEPPMTPFEIEANQPKKTKKDTIIELFQDGKSEEEIVELAETTLKYVRNTIKSIQ